MQRIDGTTCQIGNTLFQTSFREDGCKATRTVLVFPTKVQCLVYASHMAFQCLAERCIETFEIRIVRVRFFVHFESRVEGWQHVVRTIDERGLARNDGFPTSVIGIFAGILQWNAKFHQSFDNGIFAIYGNDTTTIALYFGNSTEQLVWCLLSKTDSYREIADVEFFHDIKYEVCYFVGHFISMLVYTSEDDVLIELGVTRCAECVLMATDPFSTFYPEMG